MSNPIVDKLLIDCRSGDPSMQAPAIIKLQELKVYEAVTVLLEFLSSTEWNIRSLAVEALGYLGDEEYKLVGPALMKLLADPEDVVRDDVVNALANLSYTPALEPIQYLMLNDPDWVVRASAAEAVGDLGDVGDPAVLADLELAIKDPVEPVRSYAADSIGILGTPELLPRLQQYWLAEESLETKAAILAARYRLGVWDDMNLLLELLIDAVDNADEDADPVDNPELHLAIVILHILGDLAQRKVPIHLATDVPRIREMLLKVAQTFEFEKSHAEQVIFQLEAIEREAAKHG